VLLRHPLRDIVKAGREGCLSSSFKQRVDTALSTQPPEQQFEVPMLMRIRANEPVLGDIHRQQQQMVDVVDAKNIEVVEASGARNLDHVKVREGGEVAKAELRVEVDRKSIDMEGQLS